jgi:hypothetical protein
MCGKAPPFVTPQWEGADCRSPLPLPMDGFLELRGRKLRPRAFHCPRPTSNLNERIQNACTSFWNQRPACRQPVVWNGLYIGACIHRLFRPGFGQRCVLASRIKKEHWHTCQAWVECPRTVPPVCGTCARCRHQLYSLCPYEIPSCSVVCHRVVVERCH